MSDPRVGRRRLWALLLTLAAGGAAARAHGTGPPTPPPPPTPPEPAGGSYVTHIYPPRWSWLHWWEANRQPYLDRLRQGQSRQKPDQQAVAGYRAKAVEALLAGTKSTHWQARAASALALGRVGEKAALDVLKDLAAKDRSQTVRIFALVGLGLLDSPEAETFLLGQTYPSETLRESALAGAGLLEPLSAETITGMQKILVGSRVGAATIAAWALRFRSDPKNAAFLQRVLQRSRSPWLASEALLSLGKAGRAKSVAALGKVLLAQRSTEALAAVKDLKDRHEHLVRLAARMSRQKVAYDKAHEDYLARHEQWKRANPNAGDPAGKKDVGSRRVVIGLERIYMSRLRASAAIALGRIGTPEALAALRAVLATKSDEYSDLYKAQAIMALGQVGDPAAAGALVNILRGAQVGRSSEKKDSPLRGCAALALGLYARHEPGRQERPKCIEIARVLAGRVADRGETREVRAAAAVALGLTARTENLRLLHQAAKSIAEKGDETLVGYMLLARGMLGDSNIIAPARRFLAVANDRNTMSGILARRAAVLGLGILGGQEAVPILIAAWRLNYYANREVALALSLCRAYNVTDPLVKLLGESPNALEQAFAAQCLGELFTSARPHRLTRLVGQSNYTVKNIRMVRFQAIANEFLFTYLIPAFGKEWR